MNGPQASLLADGRRLHLNHGPIDLIIEACGNRGEIAKAYGQAADRFGTILSELVDELIELRQAASAVPRSFAGPTAQRMEAAVMPLSRRFITPMAAVAGAVADEIMAALVAGCALDRAYVNNGGDIALFIAPGHSITAAIAGTGHGLGDRVAVHATDRVRGMATSGWRGRSHSLGIADAVTILAINAACADAAATLVANAVDLPGHAAVQRVPACKIAPDSDLGDRPVTQGVGRLSARETAQALASGFGVAEELRRAGLIEAAALFLGGERRICGSMSVAAALKVSGEEFAYG